MIILCWGLAACDSGLVDSLLPMDEMGPPDQGPTVDADVDLDQAPDTAPTEDLGVDAARDLGLDAGPDARADGRLDVTVDATPDAARDGAPDAGPVDATVGDGPPLDMSLVDVEPPDVDPPDPDIGPDLGPPCVDDGECAGVCGDDGRCRPCAADPECPGGRCEAGACLPCRGADDCDSRLCLDGFCQPCGRADQCADGEGCVDMRCGACAADDHCRDGEVCVEGGCVPCDPADHRGCAVDELCCADGAGPACTATDSAVQCAACGVPCDVESSDGCLDRACVCGAGEACGPEAPFCLADEAAPACVACRDDADCAPGEICARGGQCLPATVIDAIGADPALRAMSAYVSAVEDSVALAARARVTLFAPEDAAFAAVGANPLCATEIDRAALRFVRHHIPQGNERLDQGRLAAAVAVLEGGLPLDMESVESVLVTADDDGALLVDGRPLLRSIEAVNGVVHVIGEAVLATDDMVEAGCRP